MRCRPVNKGFAESLAEAGAAQPGPTSRRISYRRNQTGPAFRTFPIHQATLLPESWFEDRFVLIGADLPLIDRFPTPIYSPDGSRFLPGVVIQSHILDQLIEGRSLPLISDMGSSFLLIFVAAAGVILALLPIGFAIKSAVGLAFLISYSILGLLVYHYQLALIDLVIPTAEFVLAWGAGSAFLGWRYRGEKRFVESAFGHYLDPQLVKDLSENPDHLKLGGEIREVTSFFADIANFTSHAERNSTDRPG